MSGAGEPGAQRPAEEHSPAAGPADPGAPQPPAAGPAGPPLARAEQVLDGLPGRPVAEHVAAYDEVHRLLQDALATLDRD